MLRKRLLELKKIHPDNQTPEEYYECCLLQSLHEEHSTTPVMEDAPNYSDLEDLLNIQQALVNVANIVSKEAAKIMEIKYN